MPFSQSGGASSSGSGTTVRKTTSKTVVSSIAETDLLNGEVTLNANTIGASGLLRMTAWGDWKQNSGAARDLPRFKYKLGATTIIDTNVTGGTVAANGANRYGWRIQTETMNLGATNAQWSTVAGFIGATSSAVNGIANVTTGEGFIAMATSGGNSYNGSYTAGNGTAVDTTASLAVVLSVILPVSDPNCDIVLKAALLEII